jgi:hypothetical protein
MPAAPAPTIAMSASPEAPVAPNDGPAATAADAARNERRLKLDIALDLAGNSGAEFRS